MAPIQRIVDAHIHQWDPARTDRYPHLQPPYVAEMLGVSDPSRAARRFDQATYLDESGAWNVEKYVHVCCTPPPNHLLETLELEEESQRTSHPDALIGTVDFTDSTKGFIAQLDQQMEASRFRGVRVPQVDHTSPAARDLLTALEERGLIYDLMVTPPEMIELAPVLENYPTLSIVIEHNGWPLSTDPDHVKLWRDGMVALANVGPNVSCKISGLAMTLQECSAQAFRPWIEHSITVFGEGRCFFGSNFPVDNLFATFDELYNAYDEVTAGLDQSVRTQLFAGNAERTYHC